jgi:nickel transport protein
MKIEAMLHTQPPRAPAATPWRVSAPQPAAPLRPARQALIARARALLLALAVPLILGLGAPPAAAHGLALRVQPTPDGLQGVVSYSDDTPAAGALVELRSGSGGAGRVAVTTLTDAAGRFRMSLPAAGTWQVVARDDGGHRSESVVSWAPAVAGTENPGEAAVAGLADAQVAAALRTELAPLRDDIARLEARLRLADLVGGIGLIVGAAGGWAWWRSRRAAALAARS